MRQNIDTKKEVDHYISNIGKKKHKSSKEKSKKGSTTPHQIPPKTSSHNF